MSKKTDSGMTVDQVIDQVVANARLEGGQLDQETIEVVRKIASGEMSKEEAVAWRKARAEDAARRFDKATKDLADERRFGGPDAASTEIEMMDAAAALVAEAKDYDPLVRFGDDRGGPRQAPRVERNRGLTRRHGSGRWDDRRAVGVPIGGVKLEGLEAMVARLRRMAADPIVKALPRIREMGLEEIANTHAARLPAYVSDGRGGIVRLDPDGTRHPVRSDDLSGEKS